MAEVDTQFLERRLAQLKGRDDSSGNGGDNGGSGSGGGGQVEERLRKVEEAVVRIETTLPHLATKAGLSQLESTIVKWFVVTAFTMVGLASAISFGVARML